MKAFLITLVMLPVFAFGQQGISHKLIIPKGVKVKPLTDSLNFVADSLRDKVIYYYKVKGIDPSQCFVDSRVSEDNVHISIIIWANAGIEGGTFEFDKKTKKMKFLPDE